MIINHNPSRRNFIRTSGTLALGSLLVPHFLSAENRKVKKIGLQLYTVRKEMLDDAAGTLKQVAKIGYQEIESAKSEKGNYYGLSPQEIKTMTGDLGISLISGHVQIDNDWQKSIDLAAEAGQAYLICSVLPAKGQTIDNYQRSADIFNQSAEACKKAGLSFGYHNHASEFDKDNGQTLYDILLDRTDPKLVNMEMDLGWVIAAGADPQFYFNKYPGRFPLWHLKDVDVKLKHSTEFGKGDVNIKALFDSARKSGMKHFFIEQEEYTGTALDSAEFDYNYVSKIL
jgi:sugar phosphate isomerase/epimerase